MKKVLLTGLVAFTLVAISGYAVAWQIDVSAYIYDAHYSDSAMAFAEDYWFSTYTTMNGTGQVQIHGSGDSDSGTMTTDIYGNPYYYGDAEGFMDAQQYMGVTGCCPGCCPDEDNCECPYDYYYTAGQGATIEGDGQIYLGQAVDYYWGYQYPYYMGDVNGQELYTYGSGDFDAFQFSAQAMGDEELEFHGWAGGGYGLDYFNAWGVQGMDRYDCEFGGYFDMYGWYLDDPCADCDPCEEECPPECPPCPECPECPNGPY
jgi:hypothetical protein